MTCLGHPGVRHVLRQVVVVHVVQPVRLFVCAWKGVVVVVVVVA